MKAPKSSLKVEGFRLESRAGLYLSSIYLLLWGLSTRQYSQRTDLGVYLISGIGLLVFGILPSALFGGITGLLIGQILISLKKQLPGIVAGLIGLVVSASVVMLLFRPQLTPPSYYSYGYTSYSVSDWWQRTLFFPLLPGLIYVLSTIWVAIRLNRLNAPPTPIPVSNVYVDATVVEYIKEQYNYFTRYEIDLNLIKAGISGTEVEAAWKLVEFEALENAKRKQLRQSLGSVRVRGVKVDFNFWLTIPLLLYCLGGLIYLLPFFIILPLVILIQLAGAIWFSRREATTAWVFFGSIFLMLVLSFVAK